MTSQSKQVTGQNLVFFVFFAQIILMVIVAMTFVLPTDRGMKVPMTVTMMLAIYVQQTNVSKLIPATSPVPYIVVIFHS